MQFDTTIDDPPAGAGAAHARVHPCCCRPRRRRPRRCRPSRDRRSHCHRRRCRLRAAAHAAAARAAATHAAAARTTAAVAGHDATAVARDDLAAAATSTVTRSVERIRALATAERSECNPADNSQRDHSVHRHTRRVRGMTFRLTPFLEGPSARAAVTTGGRTDRARAHLIPSCTDGAQSITRSVRRMKIRQGGERGIRTLGTFPYTRFPIVPLRPLGHLSRWR